MGGKIRVQGQGYEPSCDLTVDIKQQKLQRATVIYVLVLVPATVFPPGRQDLGLVFP